MTNKPKCPRCGAEQASSALQGLCPDCVIRVTLNPFTETPPTEPSSPSLPKARLRYFGDYELIEEVAHGGMGVVWRARQISLNRVVAVKMIRAGLLASDAEVRRFHAEAEAAASLDHPNIVPLYEVGEHAGQQYFSMKLIEGGPLSAMMEDRGSKMEDRSTARPPSSILHPPSSAASLLAKVARAVHHAHQRGLLHRDLKPGNILVDAQGEPHVTDFGLASRLESETHFTMTGTILGTPSYMSPEQASGKVKQLTTAADIYSLGAMLYEMLTGQPPFKAATPLDTLRAVMEQEPVPPWIVRRGRARPPSPKSEIRTPKEDRNPKSETTSTTASLQDLDFGFAAGFGFRASDLDIICLKCLEKDPQRRYTSAAELAEDLDRFAGGEPIQARPTGRFRKLQLWCRRRPLVAALSAGIVAVFFIGFAVVFAEWRHAQKQLWHSNLAQARARRLTGQQGQRVESLKVLTSAWKIRPDPVLRDEAIACLALDDLEEEPGSITFTNRFVDAAFDEGLKQAAVVFTNGEVRLIQLAAPRTEATLPSAGAAVRFLKFSPDGRWLFGRATNQVLLWNLVSHELALRVPTRPYDPPSLAADFYRDSRWLSFGAGGRTLLNYLLTATNGWAAQGAGDSSGLVRGVAYLPSNSQVKRAVLTAEAVEVWERGSNAPVEILTNLPGACALAWQDSHHITVGFSNGLVRTVLFTDQGRLRYDAHTLPIRRLCLNEARMLLVSAGEEGSTAVWEISTRRRLIQTEHGQAVQLSYDGQRLAFERSGHELGVWRLRLGEVFWTREFTSQAIEDICFHPVRDEIVVTTQNGVGYYETSGPLRHLLARREGYTKSVFAPDQETLWAVQESHLQACTIPPPGTNRVESKFTRLPPVELTPGPPIRSLALMPDGQRLVATTDDAVEWLDPRTGAREPFAINVIGLEGVSVSPDGRWLATGSRDNGRPQLWDVRTGQMQKVLGSGNAAVAFSPKGEWLVVGTPWEYGIWDMASQQRRWVIPRDDLLGLAGRVAFAGDGGWAVLQVAIGQLHLYDLRRGVMLAHLQAPQPKRITALASSADGRLAVAGCHDGTLQIWDLRAVERELQALGCDW